MADGDAFLRANIALTERARDAAQLAASRAQTAERRVLEREGLVESVLDQAVATREAMDQRAAQVEDAVADNVPTHEIDGTSVRLRNPDGSWGAWVDLKGATGQDGWSPVIALETDGERLVHKLVAWVGGEGAAPSAGLYIGPAGLVATAAEATDVRGPVGLTGPAINIEVGSVSTLAPGAPATAVLTEVGDGEYELDLGIPAGDEGPPGDDGADAIPPGIMFWYAGSAPPTGFLKCNGAAISRTTYAALFGAISTENGAGDGSTTFNIPEIRGEFIRGWDDGRGVDSGRVFASAQADDFKAHTHTSFPGNQQMYGGSGTYASTGSSGATGSTGGSETRPRNKAYLAIIKY